MAASIASMIASLVSQLEDEPVNLGYLEKPQKGICSAMFQSGRSPQYRPCGGVQCLQKHCPNMWRFSTPMEVQARGDRFLFTLSNERYLNRVKKGSPWGYQRVMILIND
ncbi:hypothetical protein ACLB2K_020240 [Fragaria x ananassa]